ncbi:MAG: hypothetical protein AB7H53_19270 [Hyphomicrobium sp.]
MNDLEKFQTHILSQIDDKIKTSQWYMSHLVYIFVGFFAIIALLGGGLGGLVLINFRDERAKLDNYLNITAPQTLQKFTESETTARKNFEEQIKKQIIGKSDDSILALYGPNHKPLNGQIIPITFIRLIDRDTNEEAWGFRFHYIVKNESDFPSGPIHVKIFFTDPMKGNIPSSAHQDQFKYEINNTPENPDSLPGRFPTTYVSTMMGFVDKPPTFEASLGRIEVYYGQGKMVSANITFSSITQQ